MKRIVIVMVVALLIAAPAIEAGAARAGKTYEGTYRVPGPGGCAFGGGTSACLYAWDCRYSNSGCALVDLERPMVMARIEIVDASGSPVYARIHVRGGNGAIAELCFHAGEPLPVNVYGASELIVHIVNGTCPDSTPSTPTTGVVRVTRL